MIGNSVSILGGYGNTGRPLAEYLLPETDAQVVIAGRNIKKARDIAQHLSTKFESRRITCLVVDASDQAGLRAAFSQVDVVVAATSNSALVSQVTTAALKPASTILQYSTPQNGCAASNLEEMCPTTCRGGAAPVTRRHAIAYPLTPYSPWWFQASAGGFLEHLLKVIGSL